MNGSIGSLVSRPCLARLVRPAGRLASTRSSAPAAAVKTATHLHQQQQQQQQRGGAREYTACVASGSARLCGVAGVDARGARGMSVVTHGRKKGGFMAEMEELQEEPGSAVEFALPLAIQMYPSTKLRAENKTIGVFDDELARLAEAMFKIMYETEGVGLAAPQVGVNYRMMVYNEAGEPGHGEGCECCQGQSKRRDADSNTGETRQEKKPTLHLKAHALRETCFPLDGDPHL